jgi:hypothetical protein
VADPGVTAIHVTPAGITGATLIPLVGQPRIVPLESKLKTAGAGTEPAVEVNVSVYCPARGSEDPTYTLQLCPKLGATRKQSDVKGRSSLTDSHAARRRASEIALRTLEPRIVFIGPTPPL